jgi:hypothetical protein
MPDETAGDAYTAPDLMRNLLREIGLDTSGQIAALGGPMAEVFSEVDPRRRQTLFAAHLSAMTDAWPGLRVPRRRSTWARLLTLLVAAGLIFSSTGVSAQDLPPRTYGAATQEDSGPVTIMRGPSAQAAEREELAYRQAKEQRSRAVTLEFQRENPCPSTGLTTGACPGYVKDHIMPLACGGPDAVSNLQWQTIEDGKAKDRWERQACAR